MESYLSQESRDTLEKIVQFIKSSDEYIKCREIKLKMQSDSELLTLISRVKSLQKKYIRSNYDREVKEELDGVMNNLNNNKTYVLYNYYLEKVNEMINLVRDELNQYFTEIVSYDFLDI